MKNVAVFMNTDKLGGAERSMILQLSHTADVSLTFFIPNITGSNSIENYIKELQLGDVIKFYYPQALYSLSRSSFKFMLATLPEIIQIAFGENTVKKLNRFDHIYINGNKAAMFFFIKNFLERFKGKVTWHLRDYYHSSIVTNIVWKILNNVKTSKLELVCNSYSVKESLRRSPFEANAIRVIYNPSGLKQHFKARERIEHLGFVSMMAPWKGVHEIIFFSWLFEKELMESGIKSLKIYGDDLYATKGEHKKYKKELLELSRKFPSQLISFEGLKDPNVIFGEIDCLIHYSLESEPFGRVLIEAYDSGVPVITTGLGGAGEIVENGVNGFQVELFDRLQLFNCIKALTSDKILRADFVNKSQKKSHEIQKNISEEINNVFLQEEVS